MFGAQSPVRAEIAACCCVTGEDESSHCSDGLRRDVVMWLLILPERQMCASYSHGCLMCELKRTHTQSANVETN